MLDMAVVTQPGVSVNT